jgi:6-phosphofructokinase 1
MRTMSGQIRRIGVMTGGGDCPGLNAVIRAVVKSALHQHRMEVIGIEDGFLGLIENRMRKLSWDDASDILTRGGTILGTSNRANPQRYAVGNPPKFVDVTETVVSHIRAQKLDAVICIGGDGTMTGAANLVSRGINCIGVPKTIDNDLIGCDQTFGFDTAVQTAVDALDKIHTTAMSHHRVMVVEVMGRNAGWLALEAGIASGSDIILIPEIPFHSHRIHELLIQRHQRGRRFTIICIAEGARALNGEQIVAKRIEASPDPIRLGGISQVLATDVEDATGLEARATILGHVQRGGTPSASDRVLATRYGWHAMQILLSGKRGRMVAMQNGAITDIAIESVAGRQRTVPLDHELLQTARSVATYLGD